MADDGGISKLQARFAAIPREIRAEIEPAIDKGAADLVAAMKALAPSDEGDLRDSIRAEPGDHDLSRQIIAGDEKAFYARWTEFGTADTPAQPFFWPAWRLLKRRIEGSIGRRGSAAVRKHTS